MTETLPALRDGEACEIYLPESQEWIAAKYRQFFPGAAPAYVLGPGEVIAGRRIVARRVAAEAVAQ